MKGDMKIKTVNQKKIVALIIPAALLASGLGGCAFGNRIAYTGMIARFDASGKNSVAIAAHDQRQLITSGRESPTLVGEMRSLAHIPYGVRTARASL